MRERVKRPSANPFRFGRIVSGSAFTDREKDLLVLQPKETVSYRWGIRTLLPNVP